MSPQSLRRSRDTREACAPVESLELRRMLAAPWVVNELTLPGGETSYFDPIVVLGGRAYYVNNNGFSGAPPVLDVYRPDLGRWAKSSAAPRALGEGAAADQKAIFLEEGSDVATASVTHAEVYDTQSDTWSDELLPLTLASGVTTLTVGHNAIFAGGFTYSPSAGAQAIPSVEIYNAQTDQWTSTTLPDLGTYSMSAAAAGDKAVFSRGSLVQVLDTSTNDWSTHALAGGRADATELAVGHFVILAGGTYIDRRQHKFASDLVDVYDADTGDWSVAHLSAPQRSLAATAAGDQGIFAPETSEVRERRHGVIADVFDAATGEWSTTRLPPNTGGLERAVTLDGNPLFLTNDQINEYDPSSGQWSRAIVNAGLGGFNNVTPVANQLVVTERYYDGPYPAKSAEIVSRSALPGTPAPITPARRQVLATARPVFSWSPTPDATSYDLYLDAVTSYGLYAGGDPIHTTDTHAALPQRVGGGPHAWHVVAHTPGGDVGSVEASFSLPDAALRASITALHLPSRLTPDSTGSVTVLLRNAGNAPLSTPGFLVAALDYGPNNYSSADVAAAKVSAGLAPGQAVTLTIPLSFGRLLPTGFAYRLGISFRQRAGSSTFDQQLAIDPVERRFDLAPPLSPRHGAKTAGGQVSS